MSEPRLEPVQVMRVYVLLDVGVQNSATRPTGTTRTRPAGTSTAGGAVVVGCGRRAAALAAVPGPLPPPWAVPGCGLDRLSTSR